tara:strand:+ start:535 stop:933 length:399 start_codon:yes stop_codon:yes gene_type:complete
MSTEVLSRAKQVLWFLKTLVLEKNAIPDTKMIRGIAHQTYLLFHFIAFFGFLAAVGYEFNIIFQLLDSWRWQDKESFYQVIKYGEGSHLHDAQHTILIFLANNEALLNVIGATIYPVITALWGVLPRFHGRF